MKTMSDEDYLKARGWHKNEDKNLWFKYIGEITQLPLDEVIKFQLNFN